MGGTKDLGLGDGCCLIVVASYAPRFGLPIMFWTDRLRTRKWLLVAMVITIAMGTVLLSITNGLAAWGAIALMGMVRDGSTAVLITMVIETDGVGPIYAGTATGFVMFFFFAGNLFAPPIGNQLAEISPGAPFLFWGVLAALGIVSLLFAKSSRAENAPPGFRGIPEVIEPS